MPQPSGNSQQNSYLPYPAGSGTANTGGSAFPPYPSSNFGGFPAYPTSSGGGGMPQPSSSGYPPYMQNFPQVPGSGYNSVYVSQ